MIQCLGTEILVRMKHDTWEVLMVDRVRIVLCFEADAGMSGIWNTFFSRELHRLVCYIKLESRLVCKAGHTDSGFFGLEYSRLSETCSVNDKVVIVSAEFF